MGQAKKDFCPNVFITQTKQLRVDRAFSNPYFQYDKQKGRNAGNFFEMKSMFLFAPCVIIMRHSHQQQHCVYCDTYQS